MRFTLIDDVVERSGDRIVARKMVTRAEEYLADHFPTFPVLPGVMMVETMVQAARHLLADRDDQPLVLGGIKTLKFGSMVRPGQGLEVEVAVVKDDDGVYTCKGKGRVIGASDVSETAVNGRFTMRRLVSRPTPA
jgi:3-hydroxyacyl-[acyl-carrier-protein] dehydratase